MRKSRYPLVRRWTPEEHERLLVMAASGSRPDEIARALGRTELAEQEVLIVLMKQGNEDSSKAQAELELMRDDQRRRQQERQRILSLMQR